MLAVSDDVSCCFIENWLSASRCGDQVVVYRQGRSISRDEMRQDVWYLMHRLQQFRPTDIQSYRWALCFEDSYTFTVAFLSVLALGDVPILPGKTKEDALRKIQESFDGVVADQPLAFTVPVVNVNDHVDGVIPQYTQQAFERVYAIDGASPVVFYTSGSTGAPKAIVKDVQCLNAEIRLLVRHWCGRLQGCSVLGTVSHQHQYGFTFRVMLPMALRLPSVAEMVQFHEQLNACARSEDFSRAALITSPAFLKRLDTALSCLHFDFVLSAGGVLSFDVLDSVNHCLGTFPHEVYGSTETGVLAWRYFNGSDAKWLRFEEVTLEWSQTDSRWLARSDLIPQPEGVLLEDQLQFESDNVHFSLLGRYDRIVKIEENRVSLTEIERLLAGFEEIQEAVVLPFMAGRRQAIGAIIVLCTGEGDGLEMSARQALRKHWVASLKKVLDPIAVPRRWRFVDAIEVNAQGKRDYAKLIELLDDVPD